MEEKVKNGRGKDLQKKDVGERRRRADCRNRQRRSRLQKEKRGEKRAERRQKDN